MPEQQAFEAIRLILPEPVQQMIEERLILVEDIQKVIEYAETHRANACSTPRAGITWHISNPTASPTGSNTHRRKARFWSTKPTVTAWKSAWERQK